MTMVSSGPISLGGTATSGGLNQSVNVELGFSGTAQISMNDSAARTLAGAGGSGTQYSMSSFYGKSNQFSFTISTNQTNANLRTLAVNAGWNQSSKVVATVASGVYIYSTSTGTPGLTISGSFPGGVELINSGNILGMGGNGGTGESSAPSGGNAISLGVNVTIVNNGYIAGGGGGGASSYVGSGGGGAGGGNGGYSGSYGGTGYGGGPGSSGGNGNLIALPAQKASTGVGGGGGRILPGSGGAGGYLSGGYGGGAGGGGGSNYGGDNWPGAAGGSGGSAGSSTGSNYFWVGAGGGGWGAAGGNFTYYGYSGGAGGKAIALNGYTATRSGSGTTYGAVS